MKQMWSRFWGLKWWLKWPLISLVVVVVLAALAPAEEVDTIAEATAAVAATTGADATAVRDAGTLAATATVSPTVTPAPARTSEPMGFGDGTHLVGVDIQPGRYRATALGSCYWERLSGLTGAFDDILANDNPSGESAVVDILDGDRAFSASGCGRWTEASAPVTSSLTAPFQDGTYLVGVDIAPGVWRTPGGDSCYWQRVSGFSGDFSELLANDLPSGSAIVEILPTDAGFSATRCGIWTRVE